MNRLNVIIMALLMSVVSNYSLCEEPDFDFNIGPVTFDTGIRTGKVVDAVTGKPIRGAVVLYIWDVEEFMIESHSRLGASYETATDKQGKYKIPSQTIKSEFGDLANLEPEKVYVYKSGYVWYRVYNNKAKSFMTYLPNLKHKYRKQDNTVELQPWIDKLSHSEHMSIFDSMHSPKGTKLQKELERELELTKNEKKASEPFEQKVKEAKNKLRKDKKAYKKGALSKEEYISRLNSYLSIPDAELLKLTALALKEFDDRNSISVLIKFLKDNVYRARAFSTVIGVLGTVTGRSDLRNTTSIPRRIEIIEEVEQWWKRNKDRSKLEWFGDLFLNSKTSGAKFAALNALEKIGDKSICPYLVQCIGKENETVALCEHTLRLLSKYGDKTAVPHIKKKLYHEDVYVRRQAALVLHSLGDQSGVPIMIASLEAEKLNTRSVACDVLRKITGQDFTDGKSLRRLSPDDQKTAIEKWKKWWQENKNSVNADDIKNFSNVLERDKYALDKRYAAVFDAQKNNPDLPVFDDPNKSPEAFFEQFKKYLIEDDIDKAVSCFSPFLGERYREIFKQLGPYRRDYAESMGPIYFSSRLDNVLYYEMLTEQDEGLFSFPIHFVQISEGKWLIDEF